MSDVAKVYGEALYSLAADEGTEDDLLVGLRELDLAVREHPGYLSMLSSPTWPEEERKRLIAQAWEGHLPPSLLHFLYVLTDHRRMAALPSVIAAYETLYREAHHISVAKVSSAVPLSDAQRETLRLRLEQKTGGRVELDCRVDPALIGGLRVEMNGLRFEGTVRARLDEMKEILADTVL